MFFRTRAPHCHFTAWLQLYSRRPNWLSSILTVLLGHPIFCERSPTWPPYRIGPYLWCSRSQIDAHVGKRGQERGERCRTWGTKPRWKWRIYTNAWETKKHNTQHYTHGQAKQYLRPGLRWQEVARTREGKEETLRIFQMAYRFPSVKRIIS